MGLDAGSEAETTYKKLLTKLPSGGEVLQATYQSVEDCIKAVTEYVNVSG